MRDIKIVAATVAIGVLLGSVPALAEMNGGSPTQRGAQCFKYSSGQDKDGRFGFWQSCPQSASVATTTARPQRHSRAAAR